MVVRKMTDEEAERIFGGGLVILGQKRPQPSSANSQSSPLSQTQSSSARVVPDLQNLPEDPALAPMRELEEQSPKSTTDNEQDAQLSNKSLG